MEGHRSGTLCLVILLMVWAGCHGEKTNALKTEDVVLTAQDGLMIRGTFYEGKEGEPGLVLLHMLGRDRSDWEPFARDLQDRGYNVLAIDLRGHGESGGILKLFTEEDFNGMVLDVRAAKEYLEGRGIDRIGLIGASIGANAALKYAADDTTVRCLVLLSPGLDYRGLKTGGAAASYGDRPILIIASREDEYAASSSEALYGEAGEGRSLEVLSGAGHGTRMFRDTQLEPMLLNWLRDVGFK